MKGCSDLLIHADNSTAHESQWNAIRQWVQRHLLETGAFVYPTHTLVAATVTPILLVWLGYVSNCG